MDARNTRREEREVLGSLSRYYQLEDDHGEVEVVEGQKIRVWGGPSLLREGKHLLRQLRSARSPVLLLVLQDVKAFMGSTS